MKMEENSKKLDVFDALMAWSERNVLTILLCLVTLAFCMYSLYTVGNFQAAINSAWRTQWDNSGCVVKYSVPNLTFNWRGEYSNASSNRDQDPAGPSDSNGQKD
jgi:hypothetical protein